VRFLWTLCRYPAELASGRVTSAPLLRLLYRGFGDGACALSFLFDHQTFMLYLDPLSWDENWLSGKRPS